MRIPRLIALAGVALTIALCAPAARASGPAQWLQFGLNGENNAVIAQGGAPRWRVETGAQFSASPSIVGETLYIGNNGGLLLALNVRTGKVVWSYHAKSSLMSNPLVYRGRVIVGEGNSTWLDYGNGNVCVGNGPSSLIALDAMTGELRWRYLTPGSAMPTPVIVDDKLIHHDGAGFAVALDPMTGTLQWIRHVGSIASMVGLTPLADGSIVSAGTFPSAVFAFDPNDGSRRWTYTLPKTVSGLGDCPTASDGHGIYCDYLQPVDPAEQGRAGVKARFHVYAVSAQTGQQRWNVPLEIGITPKRNEAAIPLVYQGRLFVGSSLAPAMHAFDTQSGRLLWTLRTGGPVKGGLVAQDGTVYFGDQRGYLWAVDGATGRVLGLKHTKTSYGVGSPVIYGKSLIIGSNSGRLAAIPLEDIRSGKDRLTKKAHAA